MVGRARRGNPFPTTTFGAASTFVKNGSYMAMQPDAKATTVYSWNFALQHQIGASWLVSATYMANEMIHIWGTKQLNPAVLLTCPERSRPHRLQYDSEYEQPTAGEPNQSH